MIVRVATNLKNVILKARAAIKYLVADGKFDDIESITCKDRAEGLITKLKTFFGNI